MHWLTVIELTGLERAVLELEHRPDLSALRALAHAAPRVPA